MSTLMRMGPGLLELGESGAIANLARKCTAVTLTPEVSRDDPRQFLSGDQEPGARTEAWNLTGTLAQDYGATDAMGVLFNHRGQQMTFRFLPDSGQGQPVSGRLIVEAVALGGEVGTKPTSDFDFPLVGAPTIADDAPPPNIPPIDPENPDDGLVLSSVILASVEGARELRKQMRAAGVDFDNMREAHRKIGAIALPAVRTTATRTNTVIRAGFKATPYANPIHWGWHRKGIKPSLFATRAAQNTEPSWRQAYFRECEKILDQIKGKG